MASRRTLDTAQMRGTALCQSHTLTAGGDSTAYHAGVTWGVCSGAGKHQQLREETLQCQEDGVPPGSHGKM